MFPMNKGFNMGGPTRGGGSPLAWTSAYSTLDDHTARISRVGRTDGACGRRALAVPRQQDGRLKKGRPNDPTHFFAGGACTYRAHKQPWRFDDGERYESTNEAFNARSGPNGVSTALDRIGRPRTTGSQSARATRHSAQLASFRNPHILGKEAELAFAETLRPGSVTGSGRVFERRELESEKISQERYRSVLSASAAEVRAALQSATELDRGRMLV